MSVLGIIILSFMAGLGTMAILSFYKHFLQCMKR